VGAPLFAVFAKGGTRDQPERWATRQLTPTVIAVQSVGHEDIVSTSQRLTPVTVSCPPFAHPAKGGAPPFGLWDIRRCAGKVATRASPTSELKFILDFLKVLDRPALRSQPEFVNVQSYRSRSRWDDGCQSEGTRPRLYLHLLVRGGGRYGLSYRSRPR
jgi:hypothetical protein